jgi:hypothetical protein
MKPVTLAALHRRPSIRFWDRFNNRFGHCSRLSAILALLPLALLLAGPAPSTARAQSISASGVSAVDDHWRRTSEGWEKLQPLARATASFGPSHHASLAQTWPAAWAACMLLSIVGVLSVSAQDINRAPAGTGSNR